MDTLLSYALIVGFIILMVVSGGFRSFVFQAMKVIGVASVAILAVLWIFGGSNEADPWLD